MKSKDHVQNYIVVHVLFMIPEKPEHEQPCPARYDKTRINGPSMNMLQYIDQTAYWYSGYIKVLPSPQIPVTYA